MAYRPDVFARPAQAQGERKVEHFVPTLFIGLGGTGKNTLMHLRKRFYDTYADHRRDVVRYLVIDTDMKRWWPGEDNRREDYVPVKPREEEQVDCQISDPEFRQVFDLLEKQDDPRYASWLKPGLRDEGTKAVKDGAGQHRQFGRMAFMLNYNKIRTKIENHIESLLKTAADKSGTSDGETSVEKNTVEVVIVTSLAGGTGSGMMLDLAYLVKDVIASNDHLRSMRKGQFSTLIAVMPTVFRGEDDSAYQKLQQNAYAALLELEYFGSSKSGDELFIGEIKDEKQNRHRVGFTAPWKNYPSQFIEGHGWESCYLVDNVTPLTIHQRLSADETYQMIADYLFLDFERSEFAVQKRSNRCNLAQYQQGYIENRVRRPEAAVGDGRGIHEGTDIVFATQNSCAFNSLGIAEIAFDKEGIYRAASYRMAASLIDLKWLGDPKRLPDSEYEAIAKRDLLHPDAQSGAPPFEVDALTRLLYAKGTGNFLAAAEDDLAKVRLRSPAEGSTELLKLEAAHSQRLARSAKSPGLAAQSLEERKTILAGGPERGKLGPLRGRLLTLIAARSNQFGVAASRTLIEHYRRVLQDESERTVAVEKRSAGDMAEALAMLREADTVPIPGRRIAQRIMYPRACESASKVVVGSYQRAAASSVRGLLQGADEYLGRKDAEVPTHLDDHRTLTEIVEKSRKRLDDLRTRLDERFRQSRLDFSTDRMQSLHPTEWDEAKYDDKIIRTLAKEFLEKGPAGQVGGVDWGKLSERVFEILKDDRSGDFDEILSLWHLLEKWDKSHVNSHDDISAIAEVLAAACRKLLKRSGMNFEDVQHGSVIDLLMIKSDPPAREKKVEKLIKSGAPYLPFDAQAQQAMTGYYQMKFQTLLGTREGELGDRSRKNREQLLEQIENLSASLLPEPVRLPKPLDSSPNSLILCREVWGVPLQFYSFLNTLYGAYRQSKTQDQLHINCHQKMADLPDIRVISPDTYERIRDNVENVLLAMIRGDITWAKDCYWIELWDPVRHGKDRIAVGSRISGIIKQCCDDDSIRGFLVQNRADWEARAKPRDWAIVYASASKTYEYARREIHGDSDRHSSPLRNCYRILLDRLRARLQETEEGRLWFEYLRPRHPSSDSVEEVMRQEEAFKKIEKDGLLFRPSEWVPVYEVNWKKLLDWHLPSTTPQSP